MTTALPQELTALGADEQRMVTEGAKDALAAQEFSRFVRRAWRVAVPSADLQWGRHMEVLCDEIQAIVEESDRRRARLDAIREEYGEEADRRIQEELGPLPPLRLVLLVPPRHSKSAIVSRLFPAWRWLHRPREQFLVLSAAEDLVERDGLALRDLVRSREYAAMQALLVASGALPAGADETGSALPGGVSFALRGDQYAKKNFDNTAGGKRSGYALGSGYTGVDADVICIDDPHDIDDAFLGSEALITARMEETRHTYRDKIQDRLNSKICGVIILVMQRVHPRDLSDYMIEQGARVVCLPAEFDPTHPHRYRFDWRTVAGEPLCPGRFPLAVLEGMRKESRILPPPEGRISPSSPRRWPSFSTTTPT